jgi:hypothetical protein
VYKKIELLEIALANQHRQTDHLQAELGRNKNVPDLAAVNTLIASCAEILLNQLQNIAPLVDNSSKITQNNNTHRSF